jgi:hypothetical protein
MSFNIVEALKFNHEPKCRECSLNQIGLTSRVIFTEDIAWLPHTTLRCGELGTVVGVEEDYGGVWQLEIVLDNFHKGLSAWGNEVLLVFPDLVSVALYLAEPTCAACVS